MEQEIITGFHSTSKKNEANILKFGYDLSKCKEEEQWLGKGIYFWESLYYAVEWNYIHTHSFSKNSILNNILKNKTIFITEIFVDKDRMLDLSSPEGTILFEEFRNIVYKDLSDEERNKLKDKDDVFWIYMIKEKGFFEKFDIIKATYRKEIKLDNRKRSPRNFEKYIQSQICVKRVSNIIHNEIYNNVDRIKFFFEHIHNNRKRIGSN